ncbi:MAG: hypothetical protein FWC40_05035 [Proteobacteria bacterium]|nr:hypothetical protein [Pseudomonadota bacterium]
MRNDATFSRRFRVDLILLTIIVVVLGGWLLSHRPLKFSSHDEAGQAMMPPQMGAGEVLLVLPDESKIADDFPGMDFSFAWYNILTQEVGPFSMVLVGDLQETSFQGMRLIVIPRRAAEAMSEEQIALMARVVAQGASLLIEMPPPPWSELTAVKRKTQTTAAIKRLTDAPGSPLPPAWRDALLNIPLDTQVLRIDALDAEPLARQDLLLELDGAIAHYHRVYGAGHVFVLAFDVGQAMTAIQQGRPSDAFVIEYDPERLHPTPADLVLNEKLKTNLVPYADLLKRHILQSVLRSSPMVTLWPFPNGRRSALLLTHETGDAGELAEYIVQHEISLGLTATILATTDNTRAAWLTSLKARNFEPAVSILRPPAGVTYRHYGPSFFTPVAIERSIADQRQILSVRAGHNVDTCKMADQNWDNNYVDTFRKLTAARCRIDLTYGPSEAGHFGYLFGTGFPFLPLERNGLPFPLYILPTLVTDAYGLGDIDARFLRQLLNEANTLYQQPVVVHFSADTMMRAPHYRVLEAWLGLMAEAIERGIWVATVQGFMHHYSLRKQARIQSRFQPANRSLDVSIELPEAPFQYTLAIPLRTAYGTPQSISLNGQALDIKVLPMTGDGSQALIVAGSGKHQLQLQYP